MPQEEYSLQSKNLPKHLDVAFRSKNLKKLFVPVAKRFSNPLIRSRQHQ